MDDALRVLGPDALDLVDERAEVGVELDDHAPDALERRVRRVGAVFERQHQRHAEFARDLLRGAVVAAVGPDHRARRLAGLALDQAQVALQVVADARAVGGVVFVAAGGRIVDAGGGGRLPVALRVAEDAVMQRVRMRGDLDQPRGHHLANLRPRHERFARQLLAVVVHLRAGGRVHPAADQRDHRRVAEQLQHRIHAVVEVCVAVVEAEQHCLRRQWLAAGARLFDLGQADRAIAVLAQPGELRDQVRHLDAVAAGARRGGALAVPGNLVIRQRQEAAGRYRRRSCQRRQRREQQRQGHRQGQREQARDTGQHVRTSSRA